MTLRKFCNFIQSDTVYYLLGLFLGILHIKLLFLVTVVNGVFLNYILKIVLEKTFLLCYFHN